MNTTQKEKFSLLELLAIRNSEDFSDFLIHKAIKSYKKSCDQEGKSLGSILAICTTEREAMNLGKYDFSSITLTGLHDQEDALFHYTDSDSRMNYERQNGEALTFEAGSFDLVFCKSGLHHFSRPVLGLYEMLRVCRRGAIFIEPYETQVSRIMDLFGLRSVYERDETMNIESRDNYVFRWDKRTLGKILNSYYLESGYKLMFTLGWMSNKLNAHPSKFVRIISSCAGRIFSMLPGSEGNQIVCYIVPGNDLPPPPKKISELLQDV